MFWHKYNRLKIQQYHFEHKCEWQTLASLKACGMPHRHRHQQKHQPVMAVKLANSWNWYRFL